MQLDTSLRVIVRFSLNLVRLETILIFYDFISWSSVIWSVGKIETKQNFIISSKLLRYTKDLFIADQKRKSAWEHSVRYKQENKYKIKCK